MPTARHDGAGTLPDTPGDPDARWLAAVMHATFFLLLGTSMARYIQRHGGEPRAPWVIALAGVLAVLYVMGRFGDRPDRVVARPTPPRLLWLGAVVAVWVVLVALAPSFAWVAVPLFYVALRHLPPGAAYALVGVLTVFVIVAQLQLAPRFDLDLVVGPAAVAGFATAVFVQLRRQAARQRALIDDLVRTRRELAATERREGTLAERQRLAMEIHDTLAQGLSSQQMLLQAAERIWESDPAKAREHVRTAESVAEHNLTEARRFVHDLALSLIHRRGAHRPRPPRRRRPRPRAARPGPVRAAADRAGRPGERTGALRGGLRRADPHAPRRPGRPGRRRRRPRLRSCLLYTCGRTRPGCGGTGCPRSGPGCASSAAP